MKYIFLTGSIVFGLTGISQAMDAFRSEAAGLMLQLPMVLNFQFITVSFQPIPGYVKVFLLSFGFFVLFLIRHRLKDLGLNKIHDYFPS